MATPKQKTAPAPESCADGCKLPSGHRQAGKPAVPVLVATTETQKTFECPVCQMEHAVATKGRN